MKGMIIMANLAYVRVSTVEQNKKTIICSLYIISKSTN